MTITWFLGIWLIVRGVLMLVSAFSPSTGSRGMVLLSAAIDVLLGILLVANPGRAALDIAWVLGLVAVIWGVALIVIGLLTRKALKDLPDGSVATAGELITRGPRRRAPAPASPAAGRAGRWRHPR